MYLAVPGTNPISSRPSIRRLLAGQVRLPK
jgi:hypothetical protein